MATAYIDSGNYGVNWLDGTDAKACRPAAFILHGLGTVSVFAIEDETRLVQDGEGVTSDAATFFVDPCLRISPSWASVQRTVAEYLHYTHQQPSPLWFSNLLVFTHDSDVSPDLSDDPTAFSAIIKCHASDRNDFQHVSTASSSPLIESPTGSLSPAPQVSSFPTGPNTVGKTFSQPRVLLLSDASLPGLSSVPTASVPSAASTATHSCIPSPLSLPLPALSAVATMSPTSANTASNFRGLL